MNKEEGLNINISAPNLISVCVDTSDRGEFSGRLYQCYSEEHGALKCGAAAASHG